MSISISLHDDAKKELIRYIRQLSNMLGYTPTKNDIPQSEMAIIKKYYSAWSRIITEAGLEPFNTQHQQQLRQNALDMRLKRLAKVYKTDPGAVDSNEYQFLKLEYICRVKKRPKGFNPIESRSSKEEIKSYLQALARELGYSPTMPVTCCARQILKKYGTWFDALIAAGLERSDTEYQWALREEINEKKFCQLLKSN